eukprot:scaffold21494_cov69-Cylindrotheca_fusiformis.AAC.1
MGHGPDAFLFGESDMHDPKYDAFEVTEVFIDLDIDPALIPRFTCAPTLTLHVYPSKEFEDSFHSTKPVIYTMIVALIFVFTTMGFLLYVLLVGRRQRKAMDRMYSKISLFPMFFPVRSESASININARVSCGTSFLLALLECIGRTPSTTLNMLVMLQHQ